jgi:uncharacterized membrane protein YjgN (DUF898 family)
MQWYYANNGQRSGPVSDAEFQSLVQAGTIGPATLVWRQGMANWLPYSQVATGGAVPAAGPAAMPSSGEVAASAGGGDAGGTTGGVATLAAPVRGPEPLMFTGQWQEYFKIWIVNVLLTIVTLGVYAAWAKVRKKRYFYANTQLFGHAFEYLADPKRILIGNIIVVALFLAYTFSGAISLMIQLPFMVLIALIIPWFICRSLAFNARNSSWRGLRFRFSGGYGEAFVAFVLLPIGALLTLGALHPYGAKKRKEFVMARHSFGTTPFDMQAPVGEFYKIYLVAALFFLPVIAAYGGIIFFAVLASRNGGQPPMQPPPAFAFFGLAMIVAIPLAVVGTFFLRARIFNLTWNHTALAGHRFVATLRARDLIITHFVNSLVVGLTLGLLHPWAVCRMVQLQLSSLEVVPEGSLDDFVAASQEDVGAIGESAGDFLDFDIGIGV